jgi:hypothetical protein
VFESSVVNEDEKRQALIELLKELSIRQDILESGEEKEYFLAKFQEVYSYPSSDELYRHYYSDIFAVISQIDQKLIDGDKETLSQNMELFKTYCELQFQEQKISDNFLKAIRKLYDHVNLDVARLNYFSKIMETSEQNLKDIAPKIDSLRTEQKEIQANIDDAKKIGRDYITILGIFASIVLAFTGGIAFSTSVLENINAVSPVRLAAVIIGLAFVLINVVYILTRFIQEINKRKEEKIKTPLFIVAIDIVLIIASLIIFIYYLYTI